MIPDEILARIAAFPDDLSGWQVLTDHLLETGAPDATLALCELELLRGISNPDLIADLAEARRARTRLPYESFLLAPQWRCGFLVRATLRLTDLDPDFPQTLSAQPARGLHALTLIDPTEDELRALLRATTPHLRRCSLRLEDRFESIGPTLQRRLLEELFRALPAKVAWLDLSLGELLTDAEAALLALARKVPFLSLDGTRLTNHLEFAATLPRHVAMGGTGLSPRTAPFVTTWLAPDVEAWLERGPTGEVVPLTPSLGVDGFHAPSWPMASRYVQRRMRGWSMDDGATRDARDETFVFRLR